MSRQTLHSWLARYEAGGLEGLVDVSHRPRVVSPSDGGGAHRVADEQDGPVRPELRHQENNVGLSFCAHRRTDQAVRRPVPRPVDRDHPVAPPAAEVQQRGVFV